MIYVVTAYTEHSTPDRRIFGYFFTEPCAIRAVEENCCDMFENLYELIVIEETPCGIHPKISKEIWFRWRDKQKKYIRLKRKPSIYKTVVNFGIG